MNPAETTAMLVRPHEGEGHDFLGTCFSLKEPTAFVTAAHIVGDYAPADLSIFWPGRGRVQAAEAHRHPSADIAVLRATSDLAVYLAPEPFTHAVTNYGLAEDFIAYGYPERVFAHDADEQREPTPRVFKGHFQRFIADHHSYMGFTYRAVEVNIRAPRGLSGGPLFRPGALSVVTALMTENMKSESIESGYEEIDDDGQVHRERVSEIVSYGIALLLDGVRDWLNEMIPGAVLG